jgi:hypothetical protein
MMIIAQFNVRRPQSDEFYGNTWIVFKEFRACEIILSITSFMKDDIIFLSHSNVLLQALFSKKSPS